jgi:two-component system sensor histidine kinase MprB
MSTIRSSFERERRFVQDANHELRTPLTSLRANSELLQRVDLSPEDRKSILSDIRIEVDEITAISAELATLAVDQKPLETPVTVDLGDAVSVVVERVRKRSSRNVMLSVESVPPSLVGVRLAQFERAVSNLLDNAVKFSPPDTSVEVRVRDRSVWVVDHGPGVSDEDKSRVFTRFFRAEATRALPGSGLGLSIVKQFADDHAATIEVLDTPGGGATFVLRFPAVFAES